MLHEITVSGHSGLGRAGDMLVALCRTARPRQWMKNSLVFVAPGVAGTLGRPESARNTGIAFLVLCAAASGTYFLNDARDVANDRLHPRKKTRPVAAGTVPLAAAYAAAVALIVTAVAVSTLALGPAASACAAVYSTLTVWYSLQLKHIAVLDLVLLALAFVLRAVMGALAAAVPLSPWLLIVTAFGALFMAAGKRAADLRAAPPCRARGVPDLGYSLPFLVRIQTLAATVAVTAYCAWAFGLGSPVPERAPSPDGSVWIQLSVVPFVSGLLRYSLYLERGDGGAPEDLVLSDRFLRVAGICWVLLLAAGCCG
ncbi:decaprenyl-phosphate phosphoribosyltransferase [Streptomyces sp. NPDC058701]|uniref:decaprenyl-phosphate phosphoribosyltransferase n=1 Tax=Streptomyces sp. NPDC058701 TaxID=3346608 RepID=UPI00365A7428